MNEIILTPRHLKDDVHSKSVEDVRLHDFWMHQETIDRANIIVYVNGMESKVFKYKHN